MDDDFYKIPFVREFMEHAEAHMVPKMRASMLAFVIWNDNVDIKLALEVGTAVLLDKPIIVLAVQDEPIPPLLMGLARKVIRGDPLDESVQDRIRDEITEAVIDIERQQDDRQRKAEGGQTNS